MPLSVREVTLKDFSIHSGLQVRGGGSSSSNSRQPRIRRDAANIVSEDEDFSRRHRRGMTVALMSVYFTVMAAKCALPAVLSMLLKPPTGLTFPGSSTPESLMARLLTLATLAVAAGKLVLGPVIDRAGGIRSLQVALSGLTVLLLVISQCQSFAIFSMLYDTFITKTTTINTISITTINSM